MDATVRRTGRYRPDRGGLAGGAPRRLRLNHPVTPDGRYFVVRGRLWRMTNPAIDPAERARLTAALMAGWRAKQAATRAGDGPARLAAMAAIDAAKVALGERGPPWWDGAPDYNRRMARDTPYAAWFAALTHPP